MTVECYLLREDGPAEIVAADLDDLQEIYKFVGCECLDLKLWWIGKHRFVFIFDDEGRLKGRKVTVVSQKGCVMLVGSCLVAGFTPTAPDDFEYRDLTEEERNLIKVNLCKCLSETAAPQVLFGVLTRREDP